MKEAWIKDENENIVVDFNVNNLHLLGYSEPFEGVLSFEELKEHLYSLPEQPDLIPYLTSYYSRGWGFCMSQNQLTSLKREKKYHIKIDSCLDENGSMTYGDLVLKGKTEKEILFTTYICHPSLASNELSGPLVTAFIYDRLKSMDLYYTYRFVFVPETIGSIVYLSVHGEHLKKNLIAGFVVTCIGDAGNFTYKKSRRGDSLVDRATELVLKQSENEFTIKEFSPIGSDERQYCSPGFNLPVGSLMRTMYGEYPEYHTSADNKDLICFDAMENSVIKFTDIVYLMENNHKYLNLFPNCEPQLGKRGLYPSLGSQKDKSEEVKAMVWILNYSDGKHDILDIIQKSNIPNRVVIKVLKELIKKNVISCQLCI